MYLKDASSLRINYRELVPDDSKIWVQFLSDPESTRFFPKLDLTPEERAITWIDSQLLRYKEDAFGMLVLLEKETGIFLGQCGLLTQEIDGVEELEIGYHLLPSHRGKGYATEAAKHLKEYAFKNNLAESLISIIHVNNKSSQAVAERNGMTRDKQTKFKGMDVFIYRVFE